MLVPSTTTTRIGEGPRRISNIGRWNRQLYYRENLIKVQGFVFRRRISILFRSDSEVSYTEFPLSACDVRVNYPRPRPQLWPAVCLLPLSLSLLFVTPSASTLLLSLSLPLSPLPPLPPSPTLSLFLSLSLSSLSLSAQLLVQTSNLTTNGVTPPTATKVTLAATATPEQSNSFTQRFTNQQSATTFNRLATAPEDRSVPLPTMRVSPYKLHQSSCTVVIIVFPVLFTEELTAPRELTDAPMVTTPSPILVSIIIIIS